MKEASGELSMTLIVIIAAGVIIGVFAFFWPQIKNTIDKMWKNFDTKANTPAGMIVTNGLQDVVEGYTITLEK